MSDDRRSIEREVVVPGSLEEVWRAIATGPGISSWSVPHTVEERGGGEATASFGPGPEMQVTGRVAAREHRTGSFLTGERASMGSNSSGWSKPAPMVRVHLVADNATLYVRSAGNGRVSAWQ